MTLVARFCTVKHPLINVFGRPSTPWKDSLTKQVNNKHLLSEYKAAGIVLAMTLFYLFAKIRCNLWPVQHHSSLFKLPSSCGSPVDFFCSELFHVFFPPFYFPFVAVHVAGVAVFFDTGKKAFIEVKCISVTVFVQYTIKNKQTYMSKSISVQHTHMYMRHMGAEWTATTWKNKNKK